MRSNPAPQQVGATLLSKHPALASNAFAPAPFLWPSLPPPNVGTLTQLPCWVFNILCISGAAHALLKHHSQRGSGKTGFLLKSWSVKAFYIAACQERKYNSKEAEYVLEVISPSPVQRLWRAGARGCCRGSITLGVMVLPGILQSASVQT